MGMVFWESNSSTAFNTADFVITVLYLSVVSAHALQSHIMML